MPDWMVIVRADGPLGIRAVHVKVNDAPDEAEAKRLGVNKARIRLNPGPRTILTATAAMPGAPQR